jgi:hypothetical protein
MLGNTAAIQRRRSLTAGRFAALLGSMNQLVELAEDEE